MGSSISKFICWFSQSKTTVLSWGVIMVSQKNIVQSGYTNALFHNRSAISFSMGSICSNHAGNLPAAWVTFSKKFRWRNWSEHLRKWNSFRLKKINEKSVDLLSNFPFLCFYYLNKTTRRGFGGILGSKLSDSAREYSGNETLKNFKAYYYETRSDVAIVGSLGWSLATHTELAGLQEIARNSSFKVNPMAYLEI